MRAGRRDAPGPPLGHAPRRGPHPGPLRTDSPGGAHTAAARAGTSEVGESVRQVSSQVKSSQVVARATGLVAKATELVLKNTEWACHAAYRACTLHTACHAREGARVHTYSSTQHMGRKPALAAGGARARGRRRCARASPRERARAERAAAAAAGRRSQKTAAPCSQPIAESL